jgi:hypothetical protein
VKNGPFHPLYGRARRLATGALNLATRTDPNRGLHFFRFCGIQEGREGI